MRLKKIIEIVDKVYPDGKVLEAYEANKQQHGDYTPISVGDGLAEFIARELRETYDSKAVNEEQVDIAVESLEYAQRQLGAVIDALARIRAELIFGKK